MTDTPPPGRDPQGQADDRARLRRACDRMRQLSTGGSGLSEDCQWSPAWSSLALERAIDQTLAERGGEVTDVLRSVWVLMEASRAPLDAEMANFVQDVVVGCFRRYRLSYECASFDWMVDGLKRRPTASQAWLALVGLLECRLEEAGPAIVAALAGSVFLTEARLRLALLSSAPPPHF